ncbi:hypothetical protein ACFLVE_02290 [Chloroflexota bacterium]
MKHRLIGTMTVVVLVLALLMSMAGSALAQPSVAQFSGSVALDEGPAPGSTVQAKVGTTVVGTYTATAGSEYFMLVPQESGVPAEGAALNFYVDGYLGGSGTWNSGGNTTLNLSAFSGDTYTLNVTISGSGSVSPMSGSYASGAVVALTATAGSGYDFSSWSGDASGSSASTTVTMDSNKSVTANFVLEGAAPEEEEGAPEMDEGSEGDWLYDSTINEGPGPILLTSDGTLYAYARVGIEGEYERHVFKSDDGGRSWDKTDYWKDLDDPGRVVSMVGSSMDVETIYVTDGEYVYFTENGGGKWETLGAHSLENVLEGTEQTITSIDVASNDDEEAYIFIGTATNDGQYNGSVYWIAEEGYPSSWEDLEVGNFDVYAVGAPPDFEDSDQVFALVTNNTYTAVLENVNGSVGDWDVYGEEMLDKNDDSFEVAPVSGTWFGASHFGFPSDFDDGEELFIGVVAEGSTDGSVFRVTDGDSYNLGAEDSDVLHDIVSLVLLGETSDTTLLAGSTAAGADKVVYSTNDGDSWSDADKEPSGLGIAWVVVDPDFEDNMTAWVAVDGVEGAVSLTEDGGKIYNGISLINTDIDEIKSISFSPDYDSDETYFMLTSDNDNDTDSLWRKVGKEWTRVFVSNLNEPNLDNIDLVQVSPDFASSETVYVTQIGDDPTVFRSTDMGEDWDDLVRDPPELYSWVVADEDTIFAGTDGTVYITDDHGRREWDKETISGAGVIISFALSPDMDSDETVLAGDDDGGVFITEDMGDEWDQVGDDLDGNDKTYVAFDVDYDSNMLIYAASGDTAARCEIDTSDDWDDQDWDEFDDADLVEASSIRAVSDALYISDRTPVDEGDEGGVWRSINPDASDVDDVVLELVQEDLDDGAELYCLQVTKGSNVLWALNAQNGAENELWDWEDYLVNKVELTDPSDGEALSATDEVRFKWEELESNDGDDSADEYELRYGEDMDDKYEKVTGIDDNDYFTDDLDSGTEYMWRVRALKPFRSPWSTTISFTTKVGKVGAPVGVAPDPGATDVVLNPVFDWEKVSGADSYKITLATDSAFNNVVAEGESEVDTWAPDIALKYDTVYYWKVAAYASSGAPAGSAVTSVFRTMAEPEEPPPPVVIEENPPATINLPAPIVNIPTPAPITPAFIWAIVIIGAILVIAVIVLIVRTRRVS